MKKLFAICLIAVLAMSVAACGNGGSVFDQTEYFVEYGQSFKLPDAEGYDVTVTDESGKEVRTQYGIFRPQAGKFTATYSNGKSETKISITCADTVAPEVVFRSNMADVLEGESVELPLYAVYDASEIVEQKITVTGKEGEIEVKDNKFTAASGAYVATVSARDAHGNVGTDTFRVTAHRDYRDETLSLGELMTFDGEDYLHAVYGVDGKENFSSEIATDGYPAIENGKSGNGVLKLSSDIEHGEAYVAVRPPVESFKANRAHYIKIRVAVDRDTEWVKAETPLGKTAGRLHNLKANTWYELIVDPVLYGYFDEIAGMRLCARTNGGLNMYVDEITYEPNVTKPGAEENVQTFDDESCLTRVYQNAYNFSETKNRYEGYGTKFAITDKAFTGDAKPRKVLCAEVSEQYAGLTYFFDKPVAVDKIANITVKMTYETLPSGLFLGLMKGNGKSSAVVTNMSAKTWGWAKLGASGKMNEYVIPASYLKENSDGTVSGLWLGFNDPVRVHNRLYIESITFNFKD